MIADFNQLNSKEEIKNRGEIMERLTKVVKVFLENTNEEDAKDMKRYMKDQFEFLGIRSTERKSLQKDFLGSLDKNESINTVWVLQMWSYPHREFHYLAIDYLIKKKKVLLEEHMDLIELLIIAKSWWDTVDLIASNLVGELCKLYPNLVEKYVLKWAVSDNMWLRRTSILYQLKYKEFTDENTLDFIVRSNSGDKEFFIRKAIGWSLREYSKTNKEWVAEFISSNELSPLSVREASKYLQ